MAAGMDCGVGESDSSAALDGAGSADRPACFAVPVVGKGGDFEAVVSCGSLLRSVFDEAGGLDFDILEDVLGYAVVGKRSSGHSVAKAKILSCDSGSPHLPIAHGRRVDHRSGGTLARRGEEEHQRWDRGGSSTEK